MTQKFGVGFESLEERNLLAANVTATLVNGTLTITGTTGSDDIELQGYGVEGQVRVSVDGDLVVNGGDDRGSYGDFSGVTNIVINAGRGDDSVWLDNIVVGGEGNGGNVTINGGVGNDDILITARTFVGGEGNAETIDVDPRAIDYYFNGYSRVYGTVTISGGAGSDDIDIYAGYGSYMSIGDVEINGNDGNDDIQLAANNQGEYYYYNPNGGELDTQNVTINGGHGADDISVSASYYGAVININGNLTINGGAENDEIWTGAWYSQGLFVSGDMNLNGNAGHDQLGVFSDGTNVNIGIGYGSVVLGEPRHGNLGAQLGVTAIQGSLNMNGGTGQDELSVVGSLMNNMVPVSTSEPRGFYYPARIVAGSAFIEGGSGDDDLNAYGVGVLNGATVNGNGGNDTFCAEHNWVGGEGGFNLNGGTGFDEAFEANNYVQYSSNIKSIEEILNFCPFDQPTT